MLHLYSFLVITVVNMENKNKINAGPCCILVINKPLMTMNKLRNTNKKPKNPSPFDCCDPRFF